jgi:hypothetical protein
MAKTKISEFDTNPDLNTDVNSINIAEGCSPANINNAIRQLMADLKEWQSGSDDKYIAPAGTAAAPSWTFNGDLDTGFYSGGANVVGVSANGVSVGTFTSAGFVGNVTGNLTGNVTGNVTGNLTGNVTGNVTGNAGTVTNGVYTVGDQTIAGVKTFSSSPIVPTPTLGDNSFKAASTAFVGAQITDYAPSKIGTNASGTWGISITGNAATVTNGITTGNIGLYAPSLTGTGASGTWGINITGSAATATTAANGGVTSVNGQTGAVTQTSVDSIGSYIAAIYAVNASLSVGDTVSGSNLRYNFLGNGGNGGDFNSYRVRVNNSTYDGGGSSLSGTWRCMARPLFVSILDIDNQTISYWYPGLFVRIS